MISIIGSGRVGSSIAFLCASLAIDDVVLINRTEKKALGEALDISNAVPATSSISVSGTSDYSKIAGSDVVVITASVGMHQQRRSEMLSEQVAMIRQIAASITKHAPDAKILMVTNPVDVLTYAIQKEGFAPKNVIGVASSLDSSRFRYLLARDLGTNQSSISGALVMGEHDDSMVPIFSNARCNGVPVDDLLGPEQKQRITADIRNYWKYLREYKGQSVFGISKNTFDIVKCMIKDEPLEVPASVLLDGQYGLYDVCIGVPLTIDKRGVQIHQIQITPEEKEMLHRSAAAVKSNIARI
ncbi:malate dehydrogenase [Candidatus Nitrosotenuis cloacae]|uniref:malate dehydrogenase n=1 Tax=Candidatus Nitrosotenuis cloacae TaxID=1603555 RepID=UPI002280DFA5|nr:lactate dehydrogenase [Candidatus Nitrosotenuis cloacae]